MQLLIYFYCSLYRYIDTYKPTQKSKSKCTVDAYHTIGPRVTTTLCQNVNAHLTLIDSLQVGYNDLMCETHNPLESLYKRFACNMEPFVIRVRNTILHSFGHSIKGDVESPENCPKLGRIVIDVSFWPQRPRNAFKSYHLSITTWNSPSLESVDIHNYLYLSSSCLGVMGSWCHIPTS